MRIDIITVFPELFTNFLNESLIARARKKHLVTIAAHDLRKWTKDAHRTVDDRPYGGGPGMVLMVGPVRDAVATLQSKIKNPAHSTVKLKRKKSRVISMSAKGKQFTHDMARRWAKLDQIILIAGRYEGIDERVNRYIADEEISIGPYVTFGGEIPAMVIVEAVTRLIPGTIGKQESLKDESFNMSGVARNQLSQYMEYPHYTRPETIIIDGKKRLVPKVLLSGNHSEIERWRNKHTGTRPL